MFIEYNCKGKYIRNSRMTLPQYSVIRGRTGGAWRELWYLGGTLLLEIRILSGGAWGYWPRRGTGKATTVLPVKQWYFSMGPHIIGRFMVNTPIILPNHRCSCFDIYYL